jgi:hypothetical protein
MTGLKYKLAHKWGWKRQLELNRNVQKEELIRILEKYIAQLKREMVEEATKSPASAIYHYLNCSRISVWTLFGASIDLYFSTGCCSSRSVNCLPAIEPGYEGYNSLTSVNRCIQSGGTSLFRLASRRSRYACQPGAKREEIDLLRRL